MRETLRLQPVRRGSRPVNVRGAIIGGGAPVSVQSMTNTDTSDTRATLAQIRELQAAGCDIVRVSIPDRKGARAFAEIRKETDMPLVADIHFNFRLAIAAIEAGADKIRINPGNIGPAEHVKAIAEVAIDRGVPIRVGVNSGSVQPQIVESSSNMAEALAKSALGSVRMLESLGARDLVLSVKAASVRETLEAYRTLARSTDYPLHLGLTEAGTALAGTVKSSIAVGSLLEEGIGDTIRISLAADPCEEVRVGHVVLRALGLRERGIDLIACPTCSRCGVDLIPLAEAVERELGAIAAPLSVAVMGCVVNGPGEARAADLGIAAEKGGGVLFVGGEVVGRLREEELLSALVFEAKRLAAEWRPGTVGLGREAMRTPECVVHE